MKTPILFALELLLAALGSGCASRPETIHAAYVSESKYEGWTKERMAQEQTNLVYALKSASQRQHKTRADDTAGIWLLGLPVASMTGRGIEAEIASLKGELKALHAAAMKAGYQIAEADYEWATKKGD